MWFEDGAHGVRRPAGLTPFQCNFKMAFSGWIVEDIWINPLDFRAVIIGQ